MPAGIYALRSVLIAPYAIAFIERTLAAELGLQISIGQLAGTYFSNLEINNGDEIKKVEEPFFWMHGTDDDFLQISTHGETVFKNYQGSYSEAHRIEGAGHPDIPFVVGYTEYLEAVENFVER